MISLHPHEVFKWRAHKHRLLRRAPKPELLDVIGQVGGLQAQVMSAAELQAWARVDGITQEDIRTALWQDHSLVKTWAWRGTLHLLASGLFGTYVAALSTRTRHLRDSWLKYFGLTHEEVASLMASIRDALDGSNLTREQLADEVAKRTGKLHLREMLTSGWGSMLKPSAFRGDLCFGPSRGQAVTFVRPDQWIGDFQHEDSQQALAELLRRYLSTYGPASREDFALWFGMTPPEASRVLPALGDEIEPVTVQGWDGWKGWALKQDLADIERFDGPSSVRLLPNFDPFLVARSHNAAHAVPNHKVNADRIYRVAGWLTPVVLVDGRIEGIWEYRKGSNIIAVKLETFGRLSAPIKRGIEEELERLGTFLGAQTELELARLDR